MYRDPNRVSIETYRKFEIFFDIREENFYSISDYYDTEMKKNSYASTKKAIDTFIKENSQFKPFFAQDCNGKNYEERYPTNSKERVVQITGLRKDGRFVMNDGESDSQVSQSDEDRIFLISPNNDAVFAEFKPLLEKKKEIEEELISIKKDIFEVSKKLTLVSLKDYRKTRNS